MLFLNNFMQITITSTYGISSEIRTIANVKEIKIKPTIPYCSIIYSTYKNPNHTYSISLFNEDEITIAPGIDDKIYPKIHNKLC